MLHGNYFNPATRPADPSHRLERALQIGEQILHVLDSDGQTDHVLGNTRFFELARRQLAMSGGSRMGGERAYVADVHQSREQLQSIQKGGSAFAPLSGGTLQPERQYAGRLPRQIFAHQRMVGMILESRVGGPSDLSVFREVSSDFQRALADTVHSQRQRLNTLENQEGIEGRDRGAGIAKRHDPRE